MKNWAKATKITRNLLLSKNAYACIDRSRRRRNHLIHTQNCVSNQIRRLRRLGTPYQYFYPLRIDHLCNQCQSCKAFLLLRLYQLTNISEKKIQVQVAGPR